MYGLFVPGVLGGTGYWKKNYCICMTITWHVTGYRVLIYRFEAAYNVSTEETSIGIYIA